MDKPFNLIIAGGKTGGHLFPGIAVAQAVERLNSQARVSFVGTDAPFEVNTLKAYGYDHSSIYSKPIKGGSLLSKAFSLSVIAVSIVQSLLIMKSFRPDFVIGVGGFSSFAVVFSAWLLRIPTAIQEQNAIPGITNRMLSRFVNTIFTSFKETRGFTDLDKTRFVGNPVRTAVDDDAQHSSTCADLDPDRPTLLITGGSQGAASINQVAMDAIAKMDGAERFNIIHQTGKSDESKVRAHYKKLDLNVKARAFFNDMPRLMSTADLVIARAGAGTLSELCTFGTPALLVPFPYAADDHQTANAQNLVDAGGAVMIRDKDLTGDLLKSTIETLVTDTDQLNRMGRAMTSLAMPEADTVIATHILDTQRVKG